MHTEYVSVYYTYTLHMIGLLLCFGDEADQVYSDYRKDDFSIIGYLIYRHFSVKREL